MTTPTVVGLDLSSTCTGYCVDGFAAHCRPRGTLIERAIAMRDYVLLGPGLDQPADLVVIEAIGTRHVQTAIAISYVHALVDVQLLELGLPTLKVAPNLVKKYATGKGNAQKDQMIISCVRSGGDPNNNDEADAWWLWAIGRHLLGAPVVEETKYRADIIGAIGWKNEAAA